MNSLPSNNSLPAARGDVTLNVDWDFDVTFSDAAFYDFCGKMDDELLVLETHFQRFVTRRSLKRSSGR